MLFLIPRVDGARRRLVWCVVAVLTVLTGAAAAPADVEELRDVPYAATEHPRQRLDLYLPKVRAAGGPLPVVVFVHGGGWGGGDRASGKAMVLPYVQSGYYAGVSVGYRLSGHAPWPAQIHDCKAAIRWIRAQAVRHGLDPERIAVMGTSAGGTLATLLGVSGGMAELEGAEGPHRGESSRVTCVVNRFGRLNFLAEPAAARASPAQAPALEARLKVLFGGTLDERAEVARRASPVTHVTAGAAPVLTFHGTEDGLVPIVQAEEFDRVMRAAGVPHVLVRVVGGGHGFEVEEERRRTRQFLDRWLRGIPAEVSAQPITVSRRK
jgi:acetyl esterase/lipase